MEPQKQKRKIKIQPEMVRRKKITINLTEKEYNDLDIEINKYGYLSKSEYIRDLIEINKNTDITKNLTIEGLLNEFKNFYEFKRTVQKKN